MKIDNQMESFKVFSLVVTFFICCPITAALLTCSQADAPSLINALQPVFNLSSIRPVINSSTSIDVHLSFTLVGILGVNEKAQVLTTYIWQNLQWKNEFSRWDPAACGSEWVAVPRKLLWVPDVVINEFMDRNTAPFVPYSYLHYSGEVYDSQPVRVISSCSLDIYLFPFDIQNCTFTFNSYIHVIDQLELFFSLTAKEILENSKEEISTMGEWSLNGIQIEKVKVDTYEGYVYVELRSYISIKRHSITYVVNLLIPSCFLIAVDLFSFMLPPQNIDRSLFKMTLVLGYTVFLLNTNDMLPITGDTIPLINAFLSLCLVMMIATLLESVFVTNLLCGSADYPPAPRWFSKFVLHVLGRLVRIPPKTGKSEDLVIQNHEAHQMKDPSSPAMEENTSEQKLTLEGEKTVQVLKNMNTDLRSIHVYVEKTLRGNFSSQEWIQIGLIIDRLLFIFYVLFISISFITILVIWVLSYNKLSVV